MNYKMMTLTAIA